MTTNKKKNTTAPAGRGRGDNSGFEALSLSACSKKEVESERTADFNYFLNNLFKGK
jgi:hypothetical protein